MILILTSPDDQSTLEVIKWLNFYELNWIKIDATIPLTFIELFIDHESEEFILETDLGERIDTRDITAYWFRRGQFQLNIKTNFSDALHPDSASAIDFHLQTEINFLTDSLHQRLSQKKHLNSLQTSIPNKHHVLSVAKKIGLTIPATLVTSRKSMVSDFETKNGALISKAIQYGARFRLYEEENWIEYLSYTESYKTAELPDQFFPTLFQNKLDKAFELRIFYLAGDFYSMAIFSQKDEQTAVDFRKYNHEKPNRTVPYLLSDEYKEKLTQLMQTLRMESGSIDIVVTTDKKFVFLEVNPVGQYGMVSFPCNYNLDKKIAQYLSH